MIRQRESESADANARRIRLTREPLKTRGRRIRCARRCVGGDNDASALAELVAKGSPRAARGSVLI
jgi:hypothetical protein